MFVDGADVQEAGGRAGVSAQCCCSHGIRGAVTAALLEREEGKGREGRKEGRSAGGWRWREGDLVRALRHGEQRQHAGLCHLTPPRNARMDT